MCVCVTLEWSGRARHLKPRPSERVLIQIPGEGRECCHLQLHERGLAKEESRGSRGISVGMVRVYGLNRFKVPPVLGSKGDKHHGQAQEKDSSAFIVGIIKRLYFPSESSAVYSHP